MTIKLLRGDCRETLPTLDAGSVQAAITSPPYYGLRDYGTTPLVWGGDAECLHAWGNEALLTMNKSGGPGKQYTNVGSNLVQGSSRHCHCGAWLGSLGLEPTPELFIEHLVECFRQVRRVLRDDGCLWLNLGDSYAGSGKGPSNSITPEASQIGKSAFPSGRSGRRGNLPLDPSHMKPPPGYKPKDLMMMPFRVAMALQADGWWLRSVIPWLKRNSMPESVTDRPSTSVEYVFLLAKSKTYYWDPASIRVREGESTRRAASFRNEGPYTAGRSFNNSANNEKETHGDGPVSLDGRNRRNSDWFMESWQGLMLDEDDAPLALVVNPAGFPGAHFATFPARLVEPMVKASTRPSDTVLDCFSGAGTVPLVADRLGRHAIGCELSEAYGELASERLVGDSPMFTVLTVPERIKQMDFSA